MTPEHDAAETAAEQPIEFGQMWDRIRGQWRFVTMLTLVVTLGVAPLSLLLPNWYEGEVSIMPPGEDVSFGLGNLLKGIGVPGVKVPTQATPAEVYAVILESRRVNEEIVRRFDLKSRYHKKYMVDALKELKRHLKVKVDDVGMIIVTVEDKDPQRAADMANTACALLDQFNREGRMTRGRRMREFVGARLDSTRGELAGAEARLAAYATSHKTIATSAEASSMVSAASRAFANRAALEVQLGVLREASRGTTDEERLATVQMAQLDRQIEQMPRTGIGLAKLLRDVKVGEQLYLMLSAQHEDARLNEARDVATLELLDRATKPERKSRPHRLQLVLIAALFSFVAGVAYASLRDPDAGATSRS
jgi:uncharacterized protein involved in exopolysaccharide biosynthesis